MELLERPERPGLPERLEHLYTLPRRPTWYDLGEAYAVRNEAGSIPDQPHGVYSCIVPAARAQVTLNGRFAAGDAYPRDHGGRPSSSSCLAFSETWVRPRR